MENFTPISSLLGGALIGFSAVLLLLFLGRIAGISGIMSGVIAQQGTERHWRVLFLIGLVLGALLVALLAPDQLSLREGYPTWLLIIGGLFVGYGTRLGNGCTSGHGVCGLALFSKRSLVATLVFMASAMLTVYLLRHVFEVIA